MPLHARLGALFMSLRAKAAGWRLPGYLFETPAQWFSQATQRVVTGFDWAGRRVEALGEQAAQSASRAITWRNVALAASAPFVLPSEWRAALVRIFAYLGAIAALTMLATELMRKPEIVAITEPAPRPEWVHVEKPWPAFGLSLPGFTDETHYAIRRHADGGGRKDILSFGELGKTSRYVTIEIYRAGQEIGSFENAIDEMRVFAAEQGRVDGLRPAMPIPSKFGPFRTFDFAVGPFSGYHCAGFLHAFDDQRVRISGMSCNMNLIVDRSAITCALDRLTLISAGSDPDIARLFAQAELKRTFCGQRDPLMYATPKRPGDITHSAPVGLRGRLTAR